MLARHAENLFWAGRYVERAQDTARMLDATYHDQLESGHDDARRAWRALLQVLFLDRVFDATGRHPTDEEVNDFLVLDRSNPGAVISAVFQARENARSVRDLLSTELYEAFNDAHLGLVGRDVERDLREHPAELYRYVKRSCQTIIGTASETLTRDERWRFLMLGVLVERAEMTCRLLEVSVRRVQAEEGAPAGSTWTRALESAAGVEAFTREWTTTADLRSVVSFLLLSRTFPRSVFYSLRAAEEHLLAVDPDLTPSPPRRRLGRIRSDLEFRDVDELVVGDLVGFLEELQVSVLEVADAIEARFFRSLPSGGLHLQEVAVGPVDGADLVHPGGRR